MALTSACSRRPQPLELSAADALLAVENIDILRRNGFEIEVDEDATPGEAHRLCLVSQPTSKSTVFDMKGQDIPNSDIALLTCSIRSRRIASFDARPAGGTDGEVFQGKGNVRHACMQEERHDRNAS